MAGGVLLFAEARTSWLQARVFASAARHISYTVEPGASPSVRFPSTGPADHRLGYSALPAFIARLEARGFEIAAQARWSRAAQLVADAGLYPVYRETAQAGLTILDRHGRVAYAARTPQHAYGRFDAIPPLVVDSLLFIENRTLLEPGVSRRNPAIEPRRFARAVLDIARRTVDRGYPASGGSTLATQLEKLRHSPGGRTGSVAEKGRQMLSASLRAYLDGEDTLAARQQLVADYLDALPLGAVPGYGEVIGLGDGLRAWYGADVTEVNRLLAAGGRAPAGARELAERARAYRQVLSLVLAARRPARYLGPEREVLDRRTDGYLRALAAAGVISTGLRDAALAVRLEPRARVELPPPAFTARKAVDATRVRLLDLLGVGRLYDLDRLDVRVRATTDRAVQDEATRILEQLGDRRYARTAGLAADRLVARGDPGRITYSLTLYERGPSGLELRVQSDTYDNPLNVSEGTRLELGSTAKLRTLVTYLEIVEELHREHTAPSPGARGARLDPLSRWAADYLARAVDPSLEAMLEAAMRRTYSASPAEAFFTGGGRHTFRNFDAKDDGRVMSVREAFQRSVNLVFIRLMRDIVAYRIARDTEAPAVLADPAHPARAAYLSRFADLEGREFLRRFYERHAGATPGEALRRLAHAGPRTPVRLAVIFRSVRPQADVPALGAFLEAHAAGGRPPAARVAALHEQYDPERWNLQDRGYLARVHPLELWLVAYLDAHPDATFAEAVAASVAARQDAYRWLFAGKNRRAQRRAIQVVAETDAFRAIHASWRRLGYPFDALVPSYATALGSSGDSPAALAELAGIILNDGIRLPRVHVAGVRFAEGTPYDTSLVRRPAAGERLLSSPVAARLREELVAVVEHGTGRRLAGGIRLPGGRVLPVGGKTGTGDNRFTTFGPGGRSSRVVNRTAAFVFTIGDRHVGTLMAFVEGPAAGAYDFTSALPVQVLKHLVPTLAPLFEEAGER